MPGGCRAAMEFMVIYYIEMRVARKGEYVALICLNHSKLERQNSDNFSVHDFKKKTK